MKVTRRALARLLAAGAVVSAEAAPQQVSPDPVKRARDQFERNTQAMRNVKIPMATEPPFHFKA